MIMCKCGHYQLRDENDSFDRGQYATEFHSFTECTTTPPWCSCTDTHECEGHRA